jgi:hypothetical protein
MFKGLYARGRTVYAHVNVLQGDLVMRKSERSGTAFGAAFVVGALLSCNTIPKRELPAGGVEKADCINHCLDDVDPEPVDCAAAEQGVEFYPIPVWDFNNIASNAYSYADGSQDFLRSVMGRTEEYDIEWDGESLVPEEQSWRRSFGFEPQTRPDVVRCIGEAPADAGVFHIQGGPFRAWGGAVGRHLKCLNSADSVLMPEGDITISWNESGVSDVLHKGCGNTATTACADPTNALAYSACPARDRVDVAQMPANERFMRNVTLDLSQWDGISFWARRTNDSQPGIRLALGDKYTDDDLSYLQYHINPNDERFCERNQECGCPGGRECVNGACYDPRVDPPLEENAVTMAESRVDGAMIPVLDEDNDHRYAPCGQFMCQRGFLAFRGASDGSVPREDVAFANTTCQPFTFRGGITDNFCYDSATDRYPYENSHVCGDHWLKPVHLSTEWQFFKVPFTDLLQQGWAKEAYELDLTSAAVVRFIWGRGWVDMMLDDVRFYRNTHSKD